jgi:Leucine-rich repeat (LRR) protein
MTKLKELTILPGKVDFGNAYLLQDLRKLNTSGPSDIYFWWAVTQATALEELTINFLEEDHSLEDLALLPRLSRLYCPFTSCRCNLTSIAKLTRLQELIVSDNQNTEQYVDLQEFPFSHPRRVNTDSLQKALYRYK